jgi:hypothetical protein
MQSLREFRLIDQDPIERSLKSQGKIFPFMLNAKKRLMSFSSGSIASESNRSSSQRPKKQAARYLVPERKSGFCVKIKDEKILTADIPQVF